MSVAASVFGFIVLVTVAGALSAVLTRSTVHALMGLIVTMFGVAGLYVYLSSPFIAMMQILIYVGAVSVLIGFAIMLIGPEQARSPEYSTTGRFIGACVVALISLSLFTGFVLTVFPTVSPAFFPLSTADIGTLFFNDLVLPFELISLLIVIAILAAVMLALLSREAR